MLEGVWLSQAGRKLWLQEDLSETQMEKQDWSEREKKEISFGFEGEKGQRGKSKKVILIRSDVTDAVQMVFCVFL